MERVLRPAIGAYVMALAILAGVLVVFVVRPPSAGLWVAMVVVGSVSIGALISVGVSAWNRHVVTSGRSNLSDEEIAALFGSAKLPRALILELWHEAAHTLKVESGKLRPSDRLGKDVGSYFLTSDALDALEDLARKRTSANNVSLDLADVRTVDQYIRTVGEALSALGSGGEPPR